MPEPVTVRSRALFKAYLWGATLLCLLAALGLLVRAISWLRFVREEPTLLAFLLPVLLFAALAGWLGRWALFHTTARVTVDAEGLSMRSAVANDSLPWEAVEAIRLQGSSGSEVQLAGNGHRVTLPSGSSTPPDVTLRVQDWIAHRLGDRDLDYGGVHFWGP